MSAAHPEAVLWFKRSQRGLFAGRTRLSGNHVSPSKAQCVFVAPIVRRRPSIRATFSTLAPLSLLTPNPFLSFTQLSHYPPASQR